MAEVPVRTLNHATSYRWAKDPASAPAIATALQIMRAENREADADQCVCSSSGSFSALPMLSPSSAIRPTPAWLSATGDAAAVSAPIELGGGATPFAGPDAAAQAYGASGVPSNGSQRQLPRAITYRCMVQPPAAQGSDATPAKAQWRKVEPPAALRVGSTGQLSQQAAVSSPSSPFISPAASPSTASPTQRPLGGPGAAALQAGVGLRAGGSPTFGRRNLPASTVQGSGLLNVATEPIAALPARSTSGRFAAGRSSGQVSWLPEAQHMAPATPNVMPASAKDAAASVAAAAAGSGAASPAAGSGSTPPGSGPVSSVQAWAWSAGASPAVVSSVVNVAAMAGPPSASSGGPATAPAPSSGISKHLASVRSRLWAASESSLMREGHATPDERLKRLRDMVATIDIESAVDQMESPENAGGGGSGGGGPWPSGAAAVLAATPPPLPPSGATSSPRALRASTYTGVVPSRQHSQHAAQAMWQQQQAGQAPAASGPLQASQSRRGSGSIISTTPSEPLTFVPAPPGTAGSVGFDLARLSVANNSSGAGREVLPSLQQRPSTSQRYGSPLKTARHMLVAEVPDRERRSGNGSQSVCGTGSPAPSGAVRANGGGWLEGSNGCEDTDAAAAAGSGEGDELRAEEEEELEQLELWAMRALDEGADPATLYATVETKRALVRLQQLRARVLMKTPQGGSGGAGGAGAGPGGVQASSRPGTALAGWAQELAPAAAEGGNGRDSLLSMLMQVQRMPRVDPDALRDPQYRQMVRSRNHKDIRAVVTDVLGEAPVRERGSGYWRG